LDTFIDVKDSFNQFTGNPQKAQRIEPQHYFDGLATTSQRPNPAPRIRQPLHHQHFIRLYSFIPVQDHPPGGKHGT
jgi:hypothetical protein